MALRFGTDGIRGVANTELTPELALALGRAAARRLGAASFLVGRDTRLSGGMLLGALAAGLASEGVRVVDAGILPTPGLAWLAARRRLPAAMISASHNPFPDNGIKLLSPAGTKLPDKLEQEVQAELDALLGAPAGALQAARAPSGAAVGELVADPGAVSAYLDHLLAAVDLPGGRPLKVLLDCANGAASPVAPELCSRLPAEIEVVVVAAAPDGRNINASCGSTHAGALGPAVVAAGADLGIALDGDADRCIALDHEGKVVDGDQLLALFALDLEERGELRGDAVVVTVMSNLGLHRALSARGIRIVETPVGDRHVSDALEEGDLVLGGEQSGHLVFRREATTGDGLLTALKLLELCSRKGRPLAELAAEAMHRLPQELRSVPVAWPDRLGEAVAIWGEVAVVEAELGEAGRVLLRASGTEPAVRVMAEAEDHETASSVVDRLCRVVLRELGEPR